MITKTKDDIRTDILDTYDEVLPNLDLTSGTPERDIFVEAPLAGQLEQLWEKLIYVAKLHAPINYVDDLETDDITAYMGNYNIVPFPPTYSTGNVVFYTNSIPTEDIVITDGTIVRTRDASPIEFEVQGSYTMYADLASSYYNAEKQRWEISCDIKALNPGPDFRAGASTIVEMANSITGIDGVENYDAVTGGTAGEEIESAVERVVEVFQGRGLATTAALSRYVKAYVEAVNVVSANDPEMKRDEGLGGMIDFYVIGEDITTANDIVDITSTGLQSDVNVNYSSTGIVMEHQPVREILALIINGDLVSPTYYTLQKDEGILAGSTQAFDKVVITSTGTSTGFSFSPGDTVEINYTYNALLQTIEDGLNIPENHYINRDYLLREMDKVTVDVYMAFKENDGQDWTLIANSVETELSAFINAVKNNGSIELADFIADAKSVAGVDNIDLTTVSLTNINGGTKTEQGDILFGKNEYPVAGTITLERWTN